jgi:hypothetical protein
VIDATVVAAVAVADVADVVVVAVMFDWKVLVIELIFGVVPVDVVLMRFMVCDAHCIGVGTLVLGAGSCDTGRGVPAVEFAVRAPRGFLPRFAPPVDIVRSLRLPPNKDKHLYGAYVIRLKIFKAALHFEVLL